MSNHFMLGAVTTCAVAALVLMPAKTKAQEAGTARQVRVSVEFVDAPKSVMEKAMKSFPSGYLPTNVSRSRAALLACGAMSTKGPELRLPSDSSRRVWQDVQVADLPASHSPKAVSIAPANIVDVATTSVKGLSNALDASPHINDNGTIMLAFKIKRGVAPDPHFPSSTLSISEAMSDDQFFRRLPMVRTFKDGEIKNVAAPMPWSATVSHFTFVTVKLDPPAQMGKP